MKKLFLLNTIILSLVHCFSQAQNQLNIIEENDRFILVELNTQQPDIIDVNTTKPNSVVYQLFNGARLNKKGAPDVPFLSYTFQLPQNTICNPQIVESDFITYNNIEMSPAKGKILRSENPKDVPFTYGNEYTKDAFFPQQLFHANQKFVLRDLTGQTIHFFPIQYNPVSKEVRYYKRLLVKINLEKVTTSEAVTQSNSISETYWGIYQNLFVNFNNKNKKTRYSPVLENGNLLIVTPGKFLSTLQPFIEWKERKGYKTFVCNTDTLTGGVNENTIYNLGKYFYQNQQISFMILVGDAGDIPPRNMLFTNPDLYGPSDMGYAYITNNDHYPEFIVGRLSAENTNELQNIVNRTLAYEKTPNTNGNWMSMQLGIASEQGTGDDNQYDFEHIHDIVDSNKNQYNYIDYYELYDGVLSQGWNDAAGYPTQSMFADVVNSGVSLINYAGHGGASGIVTTGFSTTDVPTLNNHNKLPFFYVVGCSPGKFTNQTCFAEALMRAGNENTPYGTISSFMSWIDQYWDEPMEAQDEFNAILRGARPNNLKSTLGALCINSCCAMNDKYNTMADPTGGSDMTDTWIFFGDPTVSLFNKNEGTLTCTHTSEIGRDATWYSVNCAVEGATIGLYYMGKFLASSKVSGGVATFNFAPINILDTVFITATKQNYLPYYGFAKVVEFPAGTNDVSFNNDIIISPNPTNGNVNIESNNNDVLKSITINDIQGKVVYKNENRTHKYIIDTKKLSKGVYMCTIESEKLQWRRKLTVIE